MNSSLIKRSLQAVLFVTMAWWQAKTYYEEHWGKPLAFMFGAVTVVVVAYCGRLLSARETSPFQLVLRMADDKGGDTVDNQTFNLLHDRFKQLRPKSGPVRFDGFDTDGSFVWFYFHGADEDAVRHTVLSQLQGTIIRKGSYFLSKATQAFAQPSNGTAEYIGG